MIHTCRLADLYHSVNFDGKARVSIVHEAGMSKKRDIYKLVISAGISFNEKFLSVCFRRACC